MPCSFALQLSLVERPLRANGVNFHSPRNSQANGLLKKALVRGGKNLREFSKRVNTTWQRLQKNCEETKSHEE